MKHYLIIFVLSLGLIARSQNEDLALLDVSADQSVHLLDSTVTPEDFIKKWSLEGKKPIMARVIGSFEAHTEPFCGSKGTNVIIPKDSVVFLYKFFSENDCWATNYHGNWGFLPNSKVMPISKRPTRELKGSAFDTPPQLRSRISPKYPREAKKAGISGKVYFKVYIDKNGKPSRTSIIKGPQELRQATIEAVEKAKFKAAKLAGEKVGVWVTLSLNFS